MNIIKAISETIQSPEFIAAYIAVALMSFLVALPMLIIASSLYGITVILLMIYFTSVLYDEDK